LHDFFLNSFERVKIKEGVVNSSIHRHKRAHEMKPPQSENDLFEFAFDTEDKAYPIYREKIVSDKPSIACVATGIYNSSFEIS
jgi:hypothetical protein